MTNDFSQALLNFMNDMDNLEIGNYDDEPETKDRLINSMMECRDFLYRHGYLGEE